MATYNGMIGFWAKRTMDPEPQFISVPSGNPDDIAKAKSDWMTRSGYSGNMSSNNVEWVGDDYGQYFNDLATGNVKKFTGAVTDPLEQDYFDNVLRQIEDEYRAQRGQAQQSYNTLVQQMKESRQLYNKDMERTYGSALEKTNISAYDRGVGDSGIKQKQMTGLGEEKQYQVEQKDLLEKQKEQIASQDLQNRLDTISRSEQRAKFGVSNPYAGYTYT
jgi:hypothetical protein